jgi:NADH-quinone oxidoreductase subunit N
VSADDLVPLSPYLAIAAGSVLLLLVISFLRNATVAFGIAVLTLVAAALLLAGALDRPAHSIGQLLRLDGYAGVVNLLLVAAAAVTALLARGYLSRGGGQNEEFYLLLLLATLGAMTLAGAEHFATLVLGLEILSISLYVLIGYPDEWHPPLEAALKYLVLSGVASTTLLFGIALIYNATGSLSLTDQVLPGGAAGARVYLLTGNALLLAGIAFKLSLVPFHLWTPDVYQGAPAPVTGYLATVSKAAMFAFLLRYALATGALEAPALQQLVALLAVLSMLGGNLLALLQDNVKRMLAYSSIAHVGYLLVALLATASTPEQQLAVEASLIYLVGYVLTTLAAFGVVSVLAATGAAEPQDHADFQGLFWRRPLEAAILTVALLSLTGIPLTAGFIIKFYLFTAGTAAALWLLLWALVLGSAIAVYYYLRVILTMARQPQPDGPAYAGPAWDGLTILVVVSLALVSIGVFPSPLIELVTAALGMTGG